MNKRILSIAIAIITISLNAQDQHFTQFYANPTYLNPAFAGHTAQSRLALNYRNQWPSIPGAFVSYNFSYEQYVRELKSGFAIMGSRDQAGSGALSDNQLGLLYSYEIRIQRDLYLRPGIQFSQVFRNVNYNRLVFGDQLITSNNSTVEIFPDRNTSYLDVGAGAMLFGRYFWIGVAAHHINRPDESLLGMDESLLPIKYSAHGGYRIPTNRRVGSRTASAVVYAFNYKMQNEFDQLDLGFYYEFNPMVFGVWYRGLPFVKSNESELINQDAIAIMIGYEFNDIKFGYSYDLTISPLLANSGGAHEISLIYEFANPRNRKYAKRKRVIPCAKF
ncbi:MAG: type IX secretion system membrane protein PorP/SprF [Bacteroidota bacterium]